VQQHLLGQRRDVDPGVALAGDVELAVAVLVEVVEPRLGLYPIVTFQYSSTTLYQVSYHIQ
jgi:hypothetical protein